jgi:predicted murein hydrolase (TIGR00659 family)
MFWLPATLGAFLAAKELYVRAGKMPILNPTLLTIVAVCVGLVALRVTYESYFESVKILHYLLGTAVVSLAVPLYRNLQKMADRLPRIMLAMVAGSVTSVVTGFLIARGLGASALMLLSIAPKSATAAVSIEISRGIGGLPAVTACLTVATGIVGAVLGPYLLNWIGVTSASARGVALGTASHGIATARAFSESELAGCCASLAMALNAILTAILVPTLLGAIRLLGL